MRIRGRGYRRAGADAVGGAVSMANGMWRGLTPRARKIGGVVGISTGAAAAAGIYHNHKSASAQRNCQYCNY